MPVQNLSLGSRGPDVLQNQKALNRDGRTALAKLTEDGIFGPKTQARVMEFQRNNGLKADGVIGPLTRTKLGTTNVIPGPPTPPGAPSLPGGAGQGDDQLAKSIALAAKGAVSQWQTVATFVGIIVNGPTATGRRGCLVGPSLGGFMGASLATLQGEDKAIAQAVSRGVSGAFDRWQKSVAVPGLPWYPAFSAVPGPVAPPMPNVPSPLVTLASLNDELISQAALVQAMTQAASPPASPRAKAVFAKVAQQLSRAFTIFLRATMVTNVLGTGPVPTFAPPVVPVGPVVAGTAFSTPGGIVGPGLTII